VLGVSKSKLIAGLINDPLAFISTFTGTNFLALIISSLLVSVSLSKSKKAARVGYESVISTVALYGFPFQTIVPFVMLNSLLTVFKKVK
jgi:hypothetical protein